MKILFVTQSNGGVEIFLNTLLRNHSIREDDCYLITSKQFDPKMYTDIVKGFYQVDMVRNLNPVSDGLAILKLRSLIRKISPDIVFLQSSKAGGLGRLACVGLHAKVMYNPHGWAFNMQGSGIKKKIYVWIERFLAVLTDRIVVISDREKESALSYKIAKKNDIKVIYNGVDIQALKDRASQRVMSRSSLGIPQNAYVIGMVGRISQQKAPDIFVKAAQKIKRDIPNAFFVIVGDGDERELIENLISSSRLDNCFYISGWVKHPADYERLFDCAMLLSRWEGFGLVLAEYMALGKPIIATRVDAIPNLIKDGCNGLLVPMDDVNAVCNAALTLYRNKSLVDELVHNGYEIVSEKFNSERMADEYHRLFHILCNNYKFS